VRVVHTSVLGRESSVYCAAVDNDIPHLFSVMIVASYWLLDIGVQDSTDLIELLDLGNMGAKPAVQEV